MHGFRLLLFGSAWLAVAGAQGLDAAGPTVNVSVSVSVAARAKLTLTSSTVSFANADPDTTPGIVASEGPISITAKGKTSAGGTITLTVLASGDLTSEGATIPISNVSWTASGAGFAGGAMSRTLAQLVGSWVNSGSRVGTQTYVLANSWSYASGTYATTAVYTLTAP